MSFNATKKRAQDESRNVNSRRVSVRSCIQLCLYYSGLNGYTSIVEYYKKTVDLNGNNLDTATIDKILSELTELREQSKQLNQDYFNYRKKQKQQRFRAMSKKEEMIWKESWHRINLLWDKYDTEENRLKKELLYAQRQKEIVEYMKNTSIESLNKLDWTKQFEWGKEFLEKFIKYFRHRITKV